ncbi:uncharacterized protein LOC130808000 isoform X1 [Amaranthus tricolor]|uniref:uncharacterized protein LOC130808000 isoform X1 n=1 Tax=Amaranthus tricolor TaxID=29722 RepID=UPI0025859D68|nr:uncharacterized protein LOC130808000 isoform X1 [Amaranthus tricolor]
METFSSLSSIPPIIGSSTNSLSNNNETCLMRSTVKPSLNLNYPIIINPNKFKSVKFRKLKMRVEAVDEVSTVILEPAQVQVTWQIIVGTLAGVIPFVVAGIEFSKRIVVFYHGNRGEDFFQDNLYIICYDSHFNYVMDLLYIWIIIKNKIVNIIN